MTLDIWNSYICTAVKKRISEILAAKNTIKLVVENKTWKKIKKIHARKGCVPSCEDLLNSYLQCFTRYITSELKKRRQN